MVRVVVIGIDGLDADLLRVYSPALPNLRLLMLESPFLELQSCFPPDSAPAWASIYTGRNPAQHGLLSLPSGLSRQHQVNQIASLESLESPLPEGETFWEKASHLGKRVCIVNPLFPCQAASLNGEVHTVSAWESKGYWSGKKRALARYCETLHSITEQQAAAGLELLRSEPWDIFFIQFSALDAIQHVFWRYSDAGDPAYPGKNEHSRRIRNCYALFDSVIGRFRTELEDNVVFMVVSGYGHGRGNTHYLHLNEWLQTEGLLVPRSISTRLTRLLHNRVLSMRRRSPAILAHQCPYSDDTSCTFVSEHEKAIDQEATLAQVTAIPHSPTSGGIVLNEAAIAVQGNGETYEQIRHSIVQRLLHLRLQGRPVVNWARVREEMYQGQYIARFPAILFELRNEYGLSSAIHVPLTTHNPLHRAVSGTHRMQGVLLLGHLPENVRIREMTNEPTLMDIAPTILALLGEALSEEGDGQALVTQSELVNRTALSPSIGNWNP